MRSKAYPRITRNRAVLNGIPIVVGTRTPVRSIAGYYQMGLSVDEILHSLPHLTAGQVHAALAYYFDHQKEIDEIDRDLKRNRDLAYWKRQAEKFVQQPA